MISKLPWRSLTYTLKGNTSKVPVTSNILNLKYTLLNGQSFAWYAHEEEVIQEKSKEEEKTQSEAVKKATIYQGVFNKHFVQFKTTDEGAINYRAHPENDDLTELFGDYFQFSHSYPDLVKSWKERDSYFKNVFKDVQGIRILRQDPFECLVSFICSQNNNIPRITKLIYSLCEKYGDFIIEIQGKKYYSFPRLNQFKGIKEQTLRDMGFGYRAKYLVETFKMIEEKGGEKWLEELRGKDRQTIQDELCALMGIGKKVADCVALFSLDCRDVVPIDTHIKQLYYNVYHKGGKKADKESLTDKKYAEIGDFFRDKFGEFAGWAHSYLFTTELNEFKEIKTGVEVKETTKKKKVTSKKVVEEKTIVEKVTITIQKTEKIKEEEEKEEPKKVEGKTSRKRKEMYESKDPKSKDEQEQDEAENRVVTRSRKQVKKNK